MKTFIILNLLFLSTVQATNFRAPAVLDGSCHLDVPTTRIEVVNGKEKIIEIPVLEVLADQCKRVKNCMNSAEEEEMEELKRLKKFACDQEYKAIDIDVPKIKKIVEEFNGNRSPKELINPVDRKPSVEEEGTSIGR